MTIDMLLLLLFAALPSSSSFTATTTARGFRTPQTHYSLYQTPSRLSRNEHSTSEETKNIVYDHIQTNHHLQQQTSSKLLDGHLELSLMSLNRRQAAVSFGLLIFPICSGGFRYGLDKQAIVSMSPNAAWASGGATAGKYTTIPIAKRRYYGRVEQGVHDFLDLASYVIEGNADDIGGGKTTTAASSTPTLPPPAPVTPNKIYTFFDTTSVVVVAARNQAVNGQCTKADTTCRGKEVRDSRYHDMKTSMYLLANAFRINQQKAPDNLPTVRAAKEFFKEVDAMEQCVKKLGTNNNNNNLQQRDTIMAAQQHYVKALNLLDVYLDLVELPPIDSGYYDKEFDTRVGETARIM